MWFDLDSLPGPDEGFSRRSDGSGLVLITPRKGFSLNQSQWPEEWRPLRSLVLREATGEVVSAGFPKFFNAGERPEDTERLAHAMATDEPVWLLEKRDGSLVIRAVIDGQVHWRTRGLLSTGALGPLLTPLISADPLGDPAFAPDRSLLFEFTSPDWRVILDYPTAELTLVGSVRHTDLQLSDYPETLELARRLGVPVVAAVEGPPDLDSLIQAVADWAGAEGVVAVCDGGQTLVKIKAGEYLRRHRLRFGLTAKVVAELCEANAVRSLEDFGVLLREMGGDWELAQDARPHVERYVEAAARAAADYSRLASAVAEARGRFGADRKAFAVEFAVPLGQPGTAAAFLEHKGDGAGAERLLRRHAVELAFADVATEESA